MPALGPQNCDFELVTKHHTFQGGAACGFGVNNDTVGEDAELFFLWDIEAGRRPTVCGACEFLCR